MHDIVDHIVYTVQHDIVDNIVYRVQYDIVDNIVYNVVLHCVNNIVNTCSTLSTRQFACMWQYLFTEKVTHAGIINIPSPQVLIPVHYADLNG